MGKVVTLMKTVTWRDRRSETVRQRVKDADEAVITRVFYAFACFLDFRKAWMTRWCIG